jgi:hypothetical protein
MVLADVARRQREAEAKQVEAENRSHDVVSTARSVNEAAEHDEADKARGDGDFERAVDLYGKILAR